jgi:hypothetical protein
MPFRGPGLSVAIAVDFTVAATAAAFFATEVGSRHSALTAGVCVPLLLLGRWVGSGLMQWATSLDDHTAAADTARDKG